MSPAVTATASPTIIDIRSEHVTQKTDSKTSSDSKNVASSSLAFNIIQSMHMSPPCLPTIILYDDAGLDLFDRITYAPEYYLTNAEINILENFAEEICHWIPRDACVVELGSGSLRKTRLLLDALDGQAKAKITYYALDLSYDSLQVSLRPLQHRLTQVSVKGLLGTYEDGIQFLSKHIPPSTPKIVLWLGSSIGNMNRDEAAQFLYNLQATALSENDLLLIGIDRRNDPAIIESAYNDGQGLTRQFILNGLSHANRILDADVFNPASFEYHAKYNVDQGRHEAYYMSTMDQHIPHPINVKLHANQLVHVEYSYKYNQEEVRELSKVLQMNQVGQWTDSNCRYDLHLFKKI